MKQRLTLLASGLLLLAGCAMGPSIGSHEPGATLILNPEVLPAGYRIQAVAAVEPYAVSDVARVVVTLYTLSDGIETVVERDGAPVVRNVPSAQLAEPVVFDKLRVHTTYRAKCEAYMTDETPIGTGDASSYTDITVLDDDRPTVSTLKVRLKSRPFSGGAGLSLTIHDGKLSGGGSEILQDAGKLP